MKITLWVRRGGAVVILFEIPPLFLAVLAEGRPPAECTFSCSRRERGAKTMVVSVVAKYMQAYKQFGWRATLTKMYTVSFSS